MHFVTEINTHLGEFDLVKLIVDGVQLMMISLSDHEQSLYIQQIIISLVVTIQCLIRPSPLRFQLMYHIVIGVRISTSSTMLFVSGIQRVLTLIILAFWVMTLLANYEIISSKNIQIISSRRASTNEDQVSMDSIQLKNSQSQIDASTMTDLSMDKWEFGCNTLFGHHPRPIEMVENMYFGLITRVDIQSLCDEDYNTYRIVGFEYGKFVNSMIHLIKCYQQSTSGKYEVTLMIREIQEIIKEVVTNPAKLSDLDVVLSGSRLNNDHQTYIDLDWKSTMKSSKLLNILTRINDLWIPDDHFAETRIRDIIEELQGYRCVWVCENPGSPSRKVKIDRFIGPSEPELMDFKDSSHS